jgi:hypothetical protein
VPGALPFMLPASRQQDLIYVIALEEATRERKLAAVRISELLKQAADKIHSLAESTASYRQEH